MISYPAPLLCQGADEDLLVNMGEVIFPGFVRRHDGENGLRLWVDATEPNDEVRSVATVQFQTLLGVLRSWRSIAGELRDEQVAGLGAGSVRDEAGNQWILAGSALAPGIVGGEDHRFAEQAATAIDRSQHLRNALWLNGRASRTAADFYMIHEYAKRDLGGEQGIAATLGISAKEQGRLTQSANNLSPLEGGRHVAERNLVPWALEEQKEFAAELLRRWIGHLAA